MYQTLVGDMTDGFGGCPSIGGVKASRILANKKTYQKCGKLLLQNIKDKN